MADIRAALTNAINALSTEKEPTTMSLNSIVAQAEGQFSTAALKEQYKSGLDILDKLAGNVMKVDELFIDREDGGTQVLKPEQMTMEQLALHAANEVKANAQTVEFTRKFKARPADGAIAFHAILKQVFGVNATGKTIHSFFGTQRPEYRSVQVAAIREGKTVREEHIDVPWGRMEFAPLDAVFTLYYDTDPDYGWCFAVSYEAPKKHQARVKALFDAVEGYLRQNSIYRGQVLEGVGSADRSSGEVTDPKIIDPYNTDRDKIVYRKSVTLALENSIFGVIKQADALRKAGKNLGKKILLEGPNGSGKTEAGMAALQIAKEQGWTAIKCRWDEDLPKVIAFAERVGGPAVVLVEDVEKLMNPANTGSPEKMEQLLDLFDGAGSKGREVLLVMTSNHAHELSRSMSRPGRINRIISVADLDREAFQRLFETLVSKNRLKNIDYDVLFDAFPECTPVWIVEAIDRAEESVIIRTGKPGSGFATDDFLYEADGLKEQLALHHTATDRKDVPALNEALGSIVATEVKKATEDISTRIQKIADRVEA